MGSFCRLNWRSMNTLTFALLAMVAVAAAAPQYGGYGHSNYFSGSRKPLQGSYSRCKVVWKPVKRIDYKKKKEKKCHYVTIKVPVQDTKTECDTSTTKLCEDQWVCLDYPKQENLDYCQNKKWQPTNYNCKEFEEEHCRDVPFTRYEDQQKQECTWEHKRVPVQVNGKVAFRECPNQDPYEYNRDEVKNINFSGY